MMWNFRPSFFLRNSNNISIKGFLYVRYNHSNIKSCNSPISVYQSKVISGELNEDAHQSLIVEHLQRVFKKLGTYNPPKKESFLMQLLGKGNGNKEAPKGLYLYGSVGCGKTMLMDMFYECLELDNKLRVHFHEFMHDVHRKIHMIKKNMPRSTTPVNAKSVPYDPIPLVADEISEKAWCLCFDEFQVTDIADAMILKRLFEHLWKKGVIVIATSNRHPDDLYKNGLQRINFLPFIPLLKDHCDILCLDSGLDYRRMESLGLSSLKLFYDMSDSDHEVELDTWFDGLAEIQGNSIESRELIILNRSVLFNKTSGRILDCYFSDLCLRNLGPADYLEISKQFDFVIMRAIPHMNLNNRTEARRFITLIDTLYDNKVRLICSSKSPMDQIFASGAVTDSQKQFARILIGDLDIKKGDDNETASIFTGEEELFAFERIISRLSEMQTETYWNLRDERLKKFSQ